MSARSAAAGAAPRSVDAARQADALLARLERELDGDRYAGYFRDHRRRYRGDLATIAELHAGGRVLEVGSVPCHLTWCLAQLGVPVVGVDIAPERAAAFVARHGLRVLRCDVEREPLPFGEGVFELALLNEVFEHLRIDPILALREIHRVLAPGGRLVLTTPNLYALRNVVDFLRGRGLLDPYPEFLKLHTVGHMGHFREYSSREVRSFLEGCGFEVLAVRYRAWHPSRRGRLPDLAYRLAPRLRPYQIVLARKPAATRA